MTWTIARKIPFFIVSFAVFTALLITGIAYFNAQDVLMKAEESKLEAVRDARKGHLEDYLKAIREDVLILAQNNHVKTAMIEFNQAYTSLGATKVNTKDFLQKSYITNNPYPLGEKHKLMGLNDGTYYAEAHTKHHPWFKDLLEKRGYDDIFLIARNGNVVYSTFKKKDYGSNLLYGKWKSSGLGTTLRRTLKIGSTPNQVAFEDFSLYGPSKDAPASFIGAPVIENGQAIGALIFQMPIGRINNIMQNRTGLGNSGKSYLIGEDMLMRSDISMSEQSTILMREVDTDATKKALHGTSGVKTVMDYRDTLVASAYDLLQFEGTKWVILTEIDEAEIHAPADILLKRLLAVLVVTAAICVVVGVTTGRNIAVPITQMTNAMRQLADRNMTTRIPARGRKDEIGTMAIAVQIFKESMIKANKMVDEQESARAARDARTEKIEKLTARFDYKASEVMKMVASATHEMRTTAQSMSTTAEETNRQATAVSAASEQATTNVQTVATAAEELASSISEISRQVLLSADISKNAQDKATQTNQVVHGLAEAAQRIGTVVSLITDIADQTNLLALNATIESSRAGEAGIGFAVVAKEIKMLAEQTSDATEEIASQVSEVQNETGGAVSAISDILETVGQVNNIAAAIASAIEQQNAATLEIARNVQQASAGTTEVSSNIVGVSEAATQTGIASEQVLSAANQLSEQTENLKAEIESFLQEVKAA